MDVDLPAFSGMAAKCVKCRCVNVAVEWFNCPFEYLRRVCRECGYTWRERPADAAA